MAKLWPVAGGVGAPRALLSPASIALPQTGGPRTLVPGRKGHMADPEKIGKPWSDDELDAIVADYFAMLDAELAEQGYVKAHQAPP
jgi:hypothetical protein